MVRRKIYLFWLALLPGLLLGDTVTIDEKMIQSLASQQNPSRLNIEATFLEAAKAESQYQERFNTNLIASGQYSNSREKAIAVFIPVFAPATDLAVGLEKHSQLGISSKFELFTSQQSTVNGSISRATRSGARLGLSFDLWKNFGGRLDRASLESIALMKQKALLESEINQRTLELNLRKIYWTLVANAESSRISSELLKVSERQLKEAERRLKASISDKGIVARYRAQVASRTARLSSLEYQRRNLIESLQTYLPQLVGKEITLAPYSVKDKVTEVVACTAQIKSHKEVPWKFSKYDELVSLLTDDYEQKKILSDSYNDIDLKLDSQIQLSGVEQGYSNSFDDLTGQGKVGYQVGLTLRVPLGGQFGESKAIQEKIDKKRFLAQKESMDIQATAKHHQIGKTIDQLYASLQQLEINSSNLKTSAKEMERKYKQARVSAFDVIQEQELLQSSLISEVETKLSVIHILYEYFQIFSEFPCETNLLGAKS